MVLKKRPASADPVADRVLSYAGKAQTVGPIIARLWYGLLVPSDREALTGFIPSLNIDGTVILPEANDMIQLLMYSIDADNGGPQLDTVPEAVWRLIGASIVQWMCSFEVHGNSAAAPIDQCVSEYQKSWEQGRLTPALVGHTLASGTQAGENGNLAKRRWTTLEGLPVIVDPAIARGIIENLPAPMGETPVCLAYWKAMRRMVIEALAAPSLAGRLSEHFRPNFQGKPEEKRVSVPAAIEVMRDTELGRKIVAAVKAGTKIPSPFKD